MAASGVLEAHMVRHSAIELYLHDLTSTSQERFFPSAHIVQQHAVPRDTSVAGSSTGYSTYRGPSVTMMTLGYHYATAYHGQPANRRTTFNLQAQTASSSTPQVSQQTGFHGYSAGSMPTTTTQTAPDTMQECANAAGLGDAYASYQLTLQDIFQNVRDGVLATASKSLLAVSDWLLSHVEELGMCFATEWIVADRIRPGLTSDDQNFHDERIKLWNDFNHAWLAIFQRQKEMMELKQLESGEMLLVSEETLKRMGKDLVNFCDSIERHGLVDYQYGVWEEQIIASTCDYFRCIKCPLLTTCC